MRAAGLLALLLLGSPALGFYEGTDVVAVTSSAQLKGLIAKGPALVEFYAPW